MGPCLIGRVAPFANPDLRHKAGSHLIHCGDYVRSKRSTLNATKGITTLLYRVAVYSDINVNSQNIANYLHGLIILLIFIFFSVFCNRSARASQRVLGFSSVS